MRVILQKTHNFLFFLTSQQRSSNILFTQFDTDRVPLLDDGVTYCRWQLEVCPETGRNHIQGYAELTRHHSITNLKQRFSWLRGAHIEYRRGTQKQADDYCSKLETRMPDTDSIAIGVKKTPGRRTDLIRLRQLIADGASDMELLDDHFGTYLRYYNGIHKVQNLFSKPRTEPPVVHYYYGETGLGKSRYTAHFNPGAYWKLPNSKWYDGYQHQDCVVLDDLQPNEFPVQSLLRLCDRYPLLVETKGSTRNFRPHKIVITTMYDLPELFSNADSHVIAALRRRITQKLHFIHPWEPRMGEHHSHRSATPSSPPSPSD